MMINQISIKKPARIRALGRYRIITVLIMVPMDGVEPSLLAQHAPQACVSTNFTTSAIKLYLGTSEGVFVLVSSELVDSSTFSGAFPTLAGTSEGTGGAVGAALSFSTVSV